MATQRELLLIFVVSCLMISAYSEDFDSIWLVQEWPPSFCSSLNRFPFQCSYSYSQSEKFTIYGLWPENDNGSYPSYCDGSTYDSNAIDKELKEYWPNPYGGSNDETWERAWEINGKCAESKFNQREYFKKALEIRKDPKYDLLNLLKRSGVFPNNASPVVKGFVRYILKSWTGTHPGFRCKKNIHTGVDQLTRIVSCFEKDGDTPKDCPEYADKDCPEMFIWPAPGLFSSKLAMPTDTRL